MTYAPLAPWHLLAVLGGIGVVLLLGGLVRRRRGGWRWARRGLLVVLVALVGANPVFGERSSSTSERAVDIVFALDTTTSSAAEDFDGSQTRIDGMRRDVRQIVAAFPGGRFAIVGFDRSTSLLLPLTEDAAATTVAVDVVRPEIAVYSSGSRIDAPVDVLAEVFDGAESSGRTRLLVYLGDGEATAGTTDFDRFAKLRDHVDGGAVFGYGTRDGGPMRATTGASLAPGDYLREGGDGARSMSHIDEAALREIARQIDVPYAHRTGSGDAPNLVDVDARDVDTSAIRITTEVERGGYWMFAIAAGVLALVELLLLLGPLRDARALPGGRR